MRDLTEATAQAFYERFRAYSNESLRSNNMTHWETLPEALRDVYVNVIQGLQRDGLVTINDPR